MSQKLLVNDFNQVEETSEFKEYFIKIDHEDSDIGYFIEVDVQCPENLHNPRNNLPFLPERMKIEKIEKRVTNLHEKKRIYYPHKKIKTSVKSWISFEKSV